MTQPPANVPNRRNPRPPMRLAPVWLVLLAIAGCQAQHTAAPPPPPPKFPVPAFVENWFALLPVPKGDAVTNLYLISSKGLIFVYTQQNRVYVLDMSGKVLFGDQISRPGTPLRAPVVTADQIVFPTADALLLFDRQGNALGKTLLGHSTRGPAFGDKDMLYVGLDYPTGERLSAIDLTKLYAPIQWEVLVGGALSGAPVVFDNTIYAGSEDGRVWAVSDEGKAVWSDPGYVQTGGVYCDLQADEQGVYVASRDTKLYCLDRSSGLTKWVYYAGRPLHDSPVVTRTTVYQYVPGVGLAAIDKTSRVQASAKWIAPNAQQWIAEDAKFVYAADDQHAIVALDKITGAVQFRSKKAGFAAFASNLKDATLYFVTPSGRIVSARAVLRPGWVGTMVMAPQPQPLMPLTVAAAR